MNKILAFSSKEKFRKYLYFWKQSIWLFKRKMLQHRAYKMKECQKLTVQDNKKMKYQRCKLLIKWVSDVQ